jgi:hypothetical protein
MDGEKGGGTGEALGEGEKLVGEIEPTATHKRIIRLIVDIRNTGGVSLSCHRIGIDPVVHHCWSDQLFSSRQPVAPRLSHG